MTVGVSVSSANAMLDSLGDVYAQMHIGDPGANGTSNVANVSARALADLSVAANGVRTLAAPVEWVSSPWTGSAQTVTHLSAWTAETGGAFVFSVVLASQVDFIVGMHPRLNTLSISIPSIAAN
jgi:hypothetical protein